MTNAACTVEIILAVSFRADLSVSLAQKIREFCKIRLLETEEQLLRFLKETNDFEELTLEQKLILMLCALKVAQDPQKRLDFGFAALILQVGHPDDIRDFLFNLQVDNTPNCCVQ